MPTALVSGLVVDPIVEPVFESRLVLGLPNEPLERDVSTVRPGVVVDDGVGAT